MCKDVCNDVSSPTVYINLIQREAAQELLKRNEYLEGLVPNNIKTIRPSTDRILSIFDYIMLIIIAHRSKSCGFLLKSSWCEQKSIVSINCLNP